MTRCGYCCGGIVPDGAIRCAGCGMPSDPPPLFGGGQGREAADVAETGSVLAAAVIVGAVLGVMLAAGAMLAGG